MSATKERGAAAKAAYDFVDFLLARFDGHDSTYVAFALDGFVVVAARGPAADELDWFVRDELGGSVQRAPWEEVAS